MSTCRRNTSIDLGTIAVGSTYRLEFPITKDEISWTDLDSVTLTFRRPDGTLFSRDATEDEEGTWYYVTTISDIDQAGQWTIGVRAVEGSLDMTYPSEIRFSAVSPLS